MSVDTNKLAMLVRHWIDHNEGHRESYLEWRDKIQDQDLPVSRDVLSRVADLTASANEALTEALAELQGGVTASPEPHSHQQ